MKIRCKANFKGGVNIPRIGKFNAGDTLTVTKENEVVARQLLLTDEWEMVGDHQVGEAEKKRPAAKKE